MLVKLTLGDGVCTYVMLLLLWEPSLKIPMSSLSLIRAFALCNRKNEKNDWFPLFYAFEFQTEVAYIHCS